MVNLVRSLDAAFQPRPVFDRVEGDAFVFGAAPNPIIPEGVLETATIFTANASQVYLEQLGVDIPHITCMRTNMGKGDELDVIKSEALRDRQTRLLVLHASDSDPECEGQLAVLDRVNYRFERLLILSRTQYLKCYTGLLEPNFRLLSRNYSPSMGLRCVLLALAMGARRVIVSGVSFRTSGASIVPVDYARIHVKGDKHVLRKINRRGLEVYAADTALAEDSGLRLLRQPG
jgi:uncharacterized Rossmann fold enzyme